MMDMEMDDEMESGPSADYSNINDRKIPTLGAADPSFTIMGNSDGRRVCEGDPEVRRNPRHF